MTQTTINNFAGLSYEEKETALADMAMRLSNSLELFFAWPTAENGYLVTNRMSIYTQMYEDTYGQEPAEKANEISCLPESNVIYLSHYTGE